MAEVIVKHDSELCRKILLRLEEVLTGNKPNGPSNYVFEGIDPETVDFNVRRLHDIRMVYAKNMLRPDGRHGLKCWPIALRERGMDFLNDSKDDAG